MHRHEPSHLEEWATLLEVDVADELLNEQSDAWVCDDDAEQHLPGEEAR
jgi:hypothetical protein